MCTSLQGHIGGVALFRRINGDGVGSGLDLAGGLVFGGQDDVIILTFFDFALVVRHIGALGLIRPTG